MVELDVPAMIHVSDLVQPGLPHHRRALHQRRHHGLHAAHHRVTCSSRFPDLRFVIPHGGGAVPYHWGRYRGLARTWVKPTLQEHLMNNVFFDTCVYHQAGHRPAARVIPADNILFASEIVGAVRGIDPDIRPLLRRHPPLCRRHAGADRRPTHAGVCRERPQGLSPPGPAVDGPGPLSGPERGSDHGQ
jgi:hypothetical protein